MAVSLILTPLYTTLAITGTLFVTVRAVSSPVVLTRTLESPEVNVTGGTSVNNSPETVRGTAVNCNVSYGAKVDIVMACAFNDNDHANCD
jgi:hypothetical protein